MLIIALAFALVGGLVGLLGLPIEGASIIVSLFFAGMHFVLGEGWL